MVHVEAAYNITISFLCSCEGYGFTFKAEIVRIFIKHDEYWREFSVILDILYDTDLTSNGHFFDYHEKMMLNRILGESL